MGLPSEYIPSGLTVYIVVTWLFKAARRRKARTTGDVLIFDCSLPVKLTLIVAGIGFLAGSFYTAFALKDLWFSLLCGTLAFAAAVAYPSEIITDGTKVQINRWYGASESIKWADVYRLEYHRGPFTTVVIGKFGTKIAHTGMHNDPETFQAVCERQTGLRIARKEL